MLGFAQAPEIARGHRHPGTAQNRCAKVRLELGQAAAGMEVRMLRIQDQGWNAVHFQARRSAEQGAGEVVAQGLSARLVDRRALERRHRIRVDARRHRGQRIDRVQAPVFAAPGRPIDGFDARIAGHVGRNLEMRRVLGRIVLEHFVEAVLDRRIAARHHALAGIVQVVGQAIDVGQAGLGTKFAHLGKVEIVADRHQLQAADGVAFGLGHHFEEVLQLQRPAQDQGRGIDPVGVDQHGATRAGRGNAHARQLAGKSIRVDHDQIGPFLARPFPVVLKPFGSLAHQQPQVRGVLFAHPDHRDDFFLACHWTPALFRSAAR